MGGHTMESTIILLFTVSRGGQVYMYIHNEVRLSQELSVLWGKYVGTCILMV